MKILLLQINNNKNSKIDGNYISIDINKRLLLYGIETN